MPNSRGKPSPADLNRARKLLAHRELDRLLGLALAASFKGEISVRINAKDGRLGDPRVAIDQFVAPE